MAGNSSPEQSRQQRSGSVDLYVVAHSPGADKMDWLPVANTPFDTLMRLYWPSAAILDGGSAPPPVKRVD